MDILLFSTDPALIRKLHLALRAHYTVHCVIRPQRLHAALESGICGALVLDAGSIAHAPDLCLEIRAGTNLPVVAIAAGGTAAERVRLLRAGADHVLARPFRLAELKARLEATLRRVRIEN